MEDRKAAKHTMHESVPHSKEVFSSTFNSAEFGKPYYTIENEWIKPGTHAYPWSGIRGSNNKKCRKGGFQRKIRMLAQEEGGMCSMQAKYKEMPAKEVIFMSALSLKSYDISGTGLII